MTADERTDLAPEVDGVDDRSVGEELTSGRPETTPFTLLGSVVALVAVVFTVVLAVVVVVVLLA